MKRSLQCLLVLGFSLGAHAQQNVDVTLMESIKGIKLYQQTNQTSYPIINLNSGELLELHFDDLDAKVKSYYYTFELCNADWTSANLSTFDYIKGFSQVRLNQYRVSSIALTKYIHYQATLPDRNCIPTKSGNYLLKVFLDGDVNKLAFTRRLLVVDQKADVAATILQPFNSQVFRTHQKVQFAVSKSQMNILNPQQQIKIVILQNHRWDNAITNVPVTFIRQNMIEFNTENNAVFAAGKEFRWVDMRSFRLQGDRVTKLVVKDKSQDIYVQPDAENAQLRYFNFKDYNGYYFIENTDNVNPWWQGDYAAVHFTFVPTGNSPFSTKNVFVIGEMNNYNTDDSAAMTYNADKGVYEKTLFLKQGYYSYTYATKDIKKNAVAVTEQTDGNSGDTENDYTILVYFRSLAGRHDELIGATAVNSLNTRKF